MQYTLNQSPSDSTNYLRITDGSGGGTSINLSGSGSTPYVYTATYSGQIRIYNCSSNNASRVLTLSVTGGSNTQDDPSAQGSNQWIAHSYQWTGGVPPAQATAYSRYIGIYKTETETFSESFGGDAGCMDINSAGSVRIQQDRTKFSIRFQNKTTKALGAYIAGFTGDDGMRFYSDGTKYFDAWVDQGSTTYAKQLFPITTTGNLLFEYYENGGGNVANFTGFSRVTNTILPASAQVLCAGTQLTGTNTFTSAPLSSDVSFTIGYQWQSSPDSAIWTNISGATDTNYTLPATAGSLYYRRIANVSKNNTNKTGTPATISVSVADVSNAVQITVRPTPAATISGPATICQNGAANITFTNVQALAVTVTYTLNGGANQTVNVGANSTASVPVTTTTAGTFTYALVSVQYQTAPTCTAVLTGTASITVQTLPNGSISAPAICQGQVGKILFTASAGTGPYSLVINSQTYNAVASGAAFNANPAPTVTTIYNLTKITDANGCIRTTP